MSISNRAIAGLVALIVAAPAFAEDVGTITTRIAVKRLAVHSPADARRLQRHITDAALEACGASSYSLTEARAAVIRSSCYKTAIAQADAGIATETAATTPSSSTTRNP